MPTLKRPDGASLYYRLVGKDTGRPPLVLVHGWCARHELWQAQVKHFRRSHQILLFDRRGHGRSTSPGSGHTAAGHADDIAALVRATGLKKVVAIGHAGGASGTLEFLRASPRLARAGVMIDTFLYPLPRLNDPDNAFGMVLGPMIDALRGSKAKSAFRGWYTSYFDQRFDRAQTRAIVNDAANTPQAVKIAELEGMVVDTAKIARGIRQPVLWLMAGAQDQAYIAQQFGNVSFAQVCGASHFPQVEQPAQTNAMIEAFLERL